MNNPFIHWIKKHDILVFFVIVFLLMWPRAIVEAAVSLDMLPAPSSPMATTLTVLYLIGTPMIAAITVTAATLGRVGLKDFFARVFRWRVAWQWYLVALFLYPLVTLIAFTLSDLIAGSAWSVPTMWKTGFEDIRASAVQLGISPNNTLQIFAILFIVSILVPIFEELGWRAFAVPRLQEKHSSLYAALVVGVIWAVWHLPNFFTKGTDHYGMSFIWFLLTITAGSILMVWIMNHTNQSVLLPILFHGSIILAGHFLPAQLAHLTGNYMALWLTCALLVATALGVVVFYGPQRLTRHEKERASPRAAAV